MARLPVMWPQVMKTRRRVSWLWSDAWTHRGLCPGWTLQTLCSRPDSGEFTPTEEKNPKYTSWWSGFIRGARSVFIFYQRLRHNHKKRIFSASLFWSGSVFFVSAAIKWPEKKHNKKHFSVFRCSPVDAALPSHLDWVVSRSRWVKVRHAPLCTAHTSRLWCVFPGSCCLQVRTAGGSWETSSSPTGTPSSCDRKPNTAPPAPSCAACRASRGGATLQTRCWSQAVGNTAK